MKFSYNYILMFFLIALFCCQNDIKSFKYGEGVYNKNVISTNNLIAYDHYPTPQGTGNSRNANIFLLNTANNKISQLTDDKFEDSGLCWSPDGNKIVFTSRRSLNKAAQWNESDNPTYLCIYNFSTKTERILNENLSAGINSLALRLKKEGFNIDYRPKEFPWPSSPYWIDKNLIGCMIKLPFGIGSGYGDLCTIDTLGNNFTVITKIFERPEWRVLWPKWINTDSILVYLISTNSMEGKSAIALFLTHEKKLVMLTGDSVKVGTPSLSIYTNKIAYLEGKGGDDKGQLIIQDLKNNTRKKIAIDGLGPRISPHGNKIAFLREENNGDDIYIMNSDGSDIKRLTHDGGIKGSLSWSPITNE
jgi:Tol biopolymer transport system component